MFYSLFLSAALLSAGLHSGSEMPVADTLHSVTVTADRGVVVSRTDTLSLDKLFSVTDLLHQSPGLYVADNGGPAGLKTVSLRGMGSAHTALYIDGVRVGNIQSGQVDLGIIGIENFVGAVVDYAQNSISFTTAKPAFRNSPVAVTARFQCGSFGMYQPYLKADFKLNDRLSISANAAGVYSKGDFTYGDGARRANNDLRQTRAGVDLFGILEGGDYHVKAYFNDSRRGTPGSVSWPSEDRQSDKNAFVQGKLRKSFSSLYTLRFSAKAAYDDIYYTGSWGDTRYGHTDVQMNSSHEFQFFPWWKFSFAADAQWAGLHSTGYDASRFSVMMVAASSFRTEGFAANLALEYGGAFDKGETSRNYFSPSVDVRVKVCEGLDLIGFSRRAYRVPTFNELYYVGFGNPELCPEDAWLNDMGLSFSRSIADAWHLGAKLDVFANFLKDRIISAPTLEDPNIWLPYNIGKVRSVGVDAAFGARWQEDGWRLSCDVHYSWLSAIDMTPDSATFGKDIPYQARHSMTVDLKMSWKDMEFRPVWMMRAGRSDGYGNLPDWNTLDVNLSRIFHLGKAGSLVAWVAVKNLLDCRYDLVSDYPMPGRSFIVGMEYRF